MSVPRTRAKTSPSAIPLASPSSIAVLSAASRWSCTTDSYPSIASFKFSLTSAIVSPGVAQPGRLGTSAQYPPSLALWITARIFILKWWRRRELNPRPRKSTAEDYVRFRFGGFRPPRAEPARARRLSLIVFSFQLQTEAFDLSCHNDALGLPCRPNSPGRLLN